MAKSKKNKRKANLGKGRPKNSQESREYFKCIVPNCEIITRRDNLILHYKTVVTYDQAGEPISEKSGQFIGLSEKKKLHNFYFLKKGYSLFNLPPISTQTTSQSSTITNFFASVNSTKKTEVNEMSIHTDKDSDTSESTENIGIDDDDDSLNILPEAGPSTDLGELVDTNKIPDSDDQDLNVKRNPEYLSNFKLDDVFCNNLADALVEKLEEKFGGIITNPNALSDLIAEKIATSQREKNTPCETINEEEEEHEDIWMVHNNVITCRECISYSNNTNIPSKLKRARKGDFASFFTDVPKKVLNTRKKNHLKSELHIWCHKFGKEQLEFNKMATEENEIACTIQITNALFCIKTCGSASDFIKENDKDQLNYVTQNMTGNKPPTKNDSKKQFFEIREHAFKLLTTNIISSFKQVKSFSVTLDKVTCGHFPYTVIMTYFFWDGKIHILLNRVQPMSSWDYEGKGAANMVINTLKDTLGMSTATLAQKCHHFSYDGVYATNEERYKGGGSLKLTEHFAVGIGLNSGDITGNWDMAHMMQLAYGDVIKCQDDKFLPDLISDLFSIMGDFNSGKASREFHEFAEELHYSVLTNKSNQTTRFVRALLRGIQSFLRNIPCLYNINGKAAEEYNLEGDNTNAKIALKTQEKIADGKFIASIIGVAQILEEYALTSLDAQNLHFFPTSVLNSATVHMGNILKLAQKWSWNDSNPKLANIGAPKTLIEDLLLGTYKPFVSQICVSRAENRSKISTQFKYTPETLIDDEILLEEEDEEPDEVQQALSWKALIPKGEYGAGSVPIIDFTEDSLAKIEKKLSSVALRIHEQYTARFNKCKVPLLEFAKEAFSVENIEKEVSKLRIRTTFK